MDKGRRTAGVVGASSSSTEHILSVGTRPGKGQRRARRRLVGIIIVGCLVVVAILGVGAYLLLHHKSDITNNAARSTTSLNSKVPSYFSSLNAQEKINYYISQKNYTAAEAIYRSELNKATTADARAQANIGLCGIYTTKQNYQTAYMYALKAYTDEATEQTATTAAGAASNAGNDTAAAKYYQDAINLLPKQNLTSDEYAYDLRVLQARLRGVNQ